MEKLRAGIRELAGGSGGSEIAETAVIIPLLFVILLAIFWFGQAFRYYGTITHAAREGARAAVAPACATCQPLSNAAILTNVTKAINGAMSAANVDPALIQAPVKTPSLCPCGSASPSCGAPRACIVSVSAGNNVCVQPNVQLSYATPASGVGGAGTCGTSVSFSYKYPFHFTLPCWPAPCSSMDLSAISLPAQAQMRLETQ